MTEQTDIFKKVCDFLKSREAFDEGTIVVERAETHASYIFLGKTVAYKIKRPVHFPYLDMTTLEKRHKNCIREVTLNQKTAPDLYLGVIPITMENDGALKINGAGQVVEWAVKMRRFQEEDLLFTRASEKPLANELMVALAKTIADLHQKSRPLQRPNAAADMKQIIENLGQSFAALPNHAPHNEAMKYLTMIKDAFSMVEKSLHRRGEGGMIRHCHGDLHLKNILLLNGAPTPFDALEFNDQFAQIDVLYDLAFLLMDLIHLKQKAAANTLLNRYTLYAWPCFAHGGAATLPFFMALRAGIRALVSLEQAGAGAKAKALSYFDLAKELLIPQPKAGPAGHEIHGQTMPLERQGLLIVIGGLSGTGKSTVSAALAPVLGGPLGAFWIRSDLERKFYYQQDEFTPLSADCYTKAASDEIYSKMLEKAGCLLSQGQAVILDAVFLDPKERESAADLAGKHKAEFCGLILTAPEAEILARVEARKNDASDADVAVVRKQLNILKQQPPFHDKHWHEIDAAGSQAQTLQNALTVLSKKAV